MGREARPQGAALRVEEPAACCTRRLPGAGVLPALYWLVEGQCCPFSVKALTSSGGTRGSTKLQAPWAELARSKGHVSPKISANLDQGSPSGPKPSSEAQHGGVSVVGPAWRGGVGPGPNVSPTSPHLQRTACQAPGKQSLDTPRTASFRLLFPPDGFTWSRSHSRGPDCHTSHHLEALA